MNTDDLEILFDEAEKESSWYKKPRKVMSVIIIISLSVLITIPIFIIVYRYIPDMVIRINDAQSIRIDHVLTFILIFFIVRFILRTFRYLFIGLFVAIILILTINEIRGKHGFSEITKDYMDLISYMESNPVKIPFLKETKMTIRNASVIKSAVNYDNPKVRNFAVKSSLSNFNNKKLYKQYGNIILYFSIFKEVNNWNYVPDPIGEEYYAKASESIEQLAGDCDDYSILMVSCIKSVGGEARIVHTKHHLYPEVKVSKKEDFLNIVYLIKRELFYKESLGKRIYYHVDNEDNIWLNFDYTGKYPGAKYMSNEIIGILNI